MSEIKWRLRMQIEANHKSQPPPQVRHGHHGGGPGPAAAPLSPPGKPMALGTSGGLRPLPGTPAAAGRGVLPASQAPAAPGGGAPLDSGHLALLSPSCRLPVASLSLIWHFQPPVAPLSLACRFPVAVLSLPCRSPVASLSLSCRPPVAILSLPVASFRFLSPCYFLRGAFLCSPVALLSFPPVALLSLFPVASLSPSCRLPVVFLPPPCRLPVASLSPPCRPTW